MLRDRKILQLQKVSKYSSAPDASKILYCSIDGFRVTPCLEFQRCRNFLLGVGSKIVPRGDHPRLRLHLSPNLHLIISYGMVRIGFTEKYIYIYYIYITPLISEVSHYTKYSPAN